MSIIRHEIRQISDENRGQPVINQAVVHGNVAYFAGITPNLIVGDTQVLRRVDELLNLVGTNYATCVCSKITILFGTVDPANPPARACLTTDFWRPEILLKLWWLRPCHDLGQQASQPPDITLAW